MSRIYVYPADINGCGYYRLIWPARALAAQGHDVTVVMPDQRSDARCALGGMLDARNRLVDVQAPPDAEIIVMQRVTFRQLSEAVPILRRKGIAVVVDIDDDLAHIHPANPAFAALHPRNPSDHAWRWAQVACDAATMVTVSTQALLPRYAPHGRGRVLHNCIPATYLQVPRVDSAVLGWAGAVFSHPDDLQQLGAALARLVRDGARFRVVGPPDGAKEALGLDRDPESTGVVPLHEWANAVASIGVGIAPLSDTRFNAGKSWLKPIEMSSLGVPWVASPRAEYRRLHRLGAGLLADKPRVWYTLLRRVTTDPTLRQDLSAVGRRVAAELTVEGNAWRWAEAWQDAFALQRGAAPPALARA